jgi:hypothetical protein
MSRKKQRTTGGVPVTNQLIDNLAAEAEHGYQPARLRGRPRLGTGPSEIVPPSGSTRHSVTHSSVAPTKNTQPKATSSAAPSAATSTSPRTICDTTDGAVGSPSPKPSDRHPQASWLSPLRGGLGF